MSEPKLISPLLDGFAMGAPISDHDGVQCCPAMKENSDQKYIVKIISVPASQVQLDALLLTGAYKDPAEAMDYFNELANGVVKEAEFLRKVSKLEGFLAYDSWQVVPMEDDHHGYQVYLLGSYKQSLDKYTRRNPMTHLAAVNLGLDLCAALAICRRAGWIYADLKPTNIFISDDKEYRIGDLGFVRMSGLKYAGLPTKYHSPYTAPELLDPMSTLNTTVDTYAVGMILYQIYNNGKLPFDGHAAAEVYPTPDNADYEIAEIIMKAIAPDPKDRWESPLEMGQALVAYMERNTINDTPIGPPVAAVPVEDASDANTPEEPQDDVPAESSEPEDLSFMTDMVSDETAPGDADAEESDPETLSDEVSSMLTQADDLISHEVPEPVVAPEPIDVPIPAAVEAPVETETEAEPAADSEGAVAVLTDEETDAPLTGEETPANTAPGISDPLNQDEAGTDDTVPHRKHGWVAPLIVGIILALLAAGGFLFYKYYYQLTIDELHLDPFENQVTVMVDTDIDTSLLTVVCTDIYGNTQQHTLENGQTVFTDLLPDTQYKIQLEVSGFHSLVGSTSSSFSTDAVTEISGISAITGNGDGSVVLSFSVEGPGSDDWTVTYSAEGEEAQTLSFTGYTVTITGLTVGKTYAFEIAPATELYMIGENTLEFTASAIILAEDLTITDCTDGNLTVVWNAPEGAEVESWSVMCYTQGGEPQVVETNDTTFTFSGIDVSNAYTVEVTAAGMTQSVRTNISANPTTISSVSCDESDLSKLVVTWEYNGVTPENGWLLLYSYAGSDTQSVIRCDEPRAEITPRVPGATYDFVIQSADGTSVFRNTASFTCANAEKFTDYEIIVSYCTFNMCVTPDKEGWQYSDVKQSDYTTTFSVGESASILIKSSKHYIPRETVPALFVIKDENGVILSNLTCVVDLDWYNMWYKTYPRATLDVPNMPTEPGSYTLELYFNYKTVTTLTFTVAE